MRAMENDYEDATKRLELALNLKPDFKWARMWLGSYYQRSGETQKALDHYRTAIELEPTENEYWLRLSRVFEFEQRYDEALRTIDEAIQTNPEYRQHYIEGFRIAARMKQSDSAKRYVQRWLERNPDDQQFRSLFQDIDRILAEEFGIVPAEDSLRKGEQ